MSQARVCIYRPVDASGASHRLLERAGCMLSVCGPEASAEEIASAARGADALVGATYRGGVMSEGLFERCPSLRIIAKYTIGIDDVDLEAASARGILVTHAPTEANWGGVAEGTLALMLALLKRVRERDRQVKRGEWRDPALAGTYLGARQDGYPGITVGLVGLGRVGARVADLLAPWRVRLLGVDPYVDGSKFVHHGVRAVELETLLEQSDVVSLHCNLTPETRRIIDARALAGMRPTAVLINTARGDLVDVDELERALRRGAIAAAALDVLPEEPPPRSLGLLGLGDRVLLSPHMVAANAASPLEPAIAWAMESLLAALRGVVPARLCNPQALPQWRARYGGVSLLGD